MNRTGVIRGHRHFVAPLAVHRGTHRKFAARNPDHPFRRGAWRRHFVWNRRSKRCAAFHFRGSGRIRCSSRGREQRCTRGNCRAARFRVCVRGRLAVRDASNEYGEEERGNAKQHKIHFSLAYDPKANVQTVVPTKPAHSKKSVESNPSVIS